MINDNIHAVLSRAITWEQPLELSQVIDDGSHFQPLVIGQLFERMSWVEKQRKVYQPLMFHFFEKHIHVLTIKAVIPHQWQ